jgi:hypothetical protein
MVVILMSSSLGILVFLVFGLDPANYKMWPMVSERGRRGEKRGRKKRERRERVDQVITLMHTGL